MNTRGFDKKNYYNERLVFSKMGFSHLLCDGIHHMSVHSSVSLSHCLTAPALMLQWPQVQQYEQRSSVLYSTSSPSGWLHCLLRLTITIMSGQSLDNADHILPLVGKEVHVTTRQFTIRISGSNVEKHDVSLYIKFQGNRINILEITAVFIYDKKNEKPTVFFSILSLNLPPIKISNF